MLARSAGMWTRAGACALVCLAAGCSRSADPRPQLVVVVDTDAPVPSQLSDEVDLSPEATVDTVRVDILNGLDPVDGQTFAEYDAINWPLSFGLRGEPGSVRLVRVRAFRAVNAELGLQDGEAVRDPDRSATIDRLAELTIPTSGVEHVKLTLSFACIGRVAQFSPGSTCVDDTRLSAELNEGIERISGSSGASQVGTHPLVRDIPCKNPAPPGTVCVQGGFSFMGSRELVGVADDLALDAAPLQPTYIAPFFMDVTEVTVERFRTIASSLTNPEPLGPTPTPPGSYCTWDPDPSFNPTAVNCVTWETAAEACSLLGGTLPSEAQWERAASGRGQDRPYPWGNAPPACCATHVSALESCKQPATLPVGSRVDPTQCDGRADVSRDGVWDLAGNVSEWTLDTPSSFGAEYWKLQGVRFDPVSDDPSIQRVFRGSHAFAGEATTLVAWRRRGPSSTWSPGTGFRCVYPDVQ